MCDNDEDISISKKNEFLISCTCLVYEKSIQSNINSSDIDKLLFH